MSKNLQKKLFIAYLIVLPLCFLWINNALQTEPVQVSNLEEKPHVQEIKPVNVMITIIGSRYAGEYKAQMTNAETVQDLLEKLRLDNKVYFEIVDYINTKEILVDDQADTQNKWVLMYNNTDITSKIDEITLEDSGRYTLQSVKR